MKIKYFLYFISWFLIYPTFAFSKEIVTCSFRDSQNVYREFMLKRTGLNNGTFMDAEKVQGPYWNNGLSCTSAD